MVGINKRQRGEGCRGGGGTGVTDTPACSNSGSWGGGPGKASFFSPGPASFFDLLITLCINIIMVDN